MLLKRIILITFLCIGISYLKAEEPIYADPELQAYLDSYQAAEAPDSIAWYLGSIVVHTSWSDLALSQHYLNEFEELLTKFSEPIVEIEYYNAKGVFHYAKRTSIDTILHFYNLAEEKLDQHELKQIKLRIGLKNNKAITYARENLKEAAIKEYLAGLEIVASTEIKMPRYETALYSNIAFMLNGSERYEDALSYIIKGESANKLYEKSTGERSNFYEWILLTKATSLYHLERVTESENILLELQSLYKTTNIESTQVKTLLGQVYYKLDKKNLGKQLLLTAIEDAVTLNIGLETEANAKYALAQIEYLEGNHFVALNYLENIIALHIKQNSPLTDPNIYALKAKVLEADKQFEESLVYFKKYHALIDKVRKEENKMSHGELKGQFSNIERKYQINELEIKQKLQESKLSVLLVALIFSLLMILSIYTMYTRKNAHNKALVKINQEIKLANKKVVAASKAKENFLSRISHEMRTPMNAVIGIADILLDENPTKKQEAYLKNQKFSGELLLNTINEVLIYSKITNNKIEINRKPSHLQNFLDMTIDSFRFGNKNQNVRIFQDQKLHGLKNLVLSDKSLFGQVLVNLIGNAVKFTEEGHVILRSEILENNENTVHVHFQIEDTGIGIPAEKMQSILDCFSQGNNEITRSHDGTGLGLTITQGLLNLKNSVLKVESTHGVGSTFSFSLIFDKAEPILKPTKADNNPDKIFQSGIEGKRILLVEDNKLNQLVAKKVLQKFMVEVALAENGKQAVDMIQDKSYDLILMDIHMPIMDGLEATRNIRALDDPYFQQVPIVALSADAYSEKVQATSESGMNDYLAKPFKPEDLFDKLKSNIEKSFGFRSASI